MQRKALLIGCQDYSANETFKSLTCPNEDVQQFESALADPTVGRFDSVTTALDCVSRADAMAAIKVFVDNLKTTDLAVFYFSGHGQIDDELHLVMPETDEDDLTGTGVSMSDVVKRLSQNTCSEVAIVLDCCYSGGAQQAFQLHDTWSGRAFAILTSSTDVQASVAKEGDTTSLFTKYLLEGLTTGNADLDGDGLIRVSEAYTYAYNALNGLQVQTPMIFTISEGPIEIAHDPFFTGKLSAADVAVDDLRKFAAIESMIRMVGEIEDASFFVMLLPHYYIEGIPYGASGLTISQDHTPNMRPTADSFQCDAFFPPHLLDEPALAGKEVVNDLVKVRMEVKYSDILLVTGRVNDQQIDLLT